ncbi:MAG TPA: chemotaxis protein CheW [Acidimicrobiia bacterium]|nr:chemotaxis protein CheW [Acidimicrobiia bacterium]
MGDVVVVRAGGHVYGIPLETVVEVTRMVALAAAPAGQTWAAGLLDLRGAPVPVVDVAPRLGLTPQAPVLDRRIVVARHPADPAASLGLVVDEVSGVAPAGTPLLDLTALVGGASGAG